MKDQSNEDSDQEQDQHEEYESAEEESELLRRSYRQRRPPKHLFEYEACVST